MLRLRRGNFCHVYDMNPLVVLIIAAVVVLIWFLVGRVRDRMGRKY